MNYSIFDLFTIGIGPSASHTVGPMRAALVFAKYLQDNKLLPRVARLQVVLCGSLAFTGRGHGTDKAVVLGLHGQQPETIDPAYLTSYYQQVVASNKLSLLGHELSFDPRRDLLFDRKLKKAHNTMLFSAYSDKGRLLGRERTYRSVGGGFIVSGNKRSIGAGIIVSGNKIDVDDGITYPFGNAGELLEHCSENNFSISDVAFYNEIAHHPRTTIFKKLDEILLVMQQSIDRGINSSGYLPPMRVKRRAPDLYRKLQKQTDDQLRPLDWVNMYAMAVSEENASGSRIVAAPTNGASGIIPAVIAYYKKFHPPAPRQQQRRLLMTAANIGLLYKVNASLSGAEVGCQGEVGVACSMAAAGLTEILGGTPQQVEQAAEIAIEHNLGLTCDPIGGLVQIPCIERNAMGAVKAINASRIALLSDGDNVVSLDQAIKTMLQTGLDMKSKYKETSRGGLAVNVIEC